MRYFQTKAQCLCKYMKGFGKFSSKSDKLWIRKIMQSYSSLGSCQNICSYLMKLRLGWILICRDVKKMCDTCRREHRLEEAPHIHTSWKLFQSYAVLLRICRLGKRKLRKWAELVRREITQKWQRLITHTMRSNHAIVAKPYIVSTKQL